MIGSFHAPSNVIKRSSNRRDTEYGWNPTFRNIRQLDCLGWGDHVKTASELAE
jgi:hypothetical protein